MNGQTVTARNPRGRRDNSTTIRAGPSTRPGTLKSTRRPHAQGSLVTQHRKMFGIPKLDDRTR
ncbi:hypothetical protein SCATT_p00790 (plasmid) [Streptantibioticus cattleyicolor NRRL 8057 = DSM 46488]|uniref:Uncharacterized protein n=1 Tax=Streptantibioticus cattleyicolor (strain ATCC 35852 / DSM 46488 / JCM 4925 / NBRC 14057 / NRRL 8057) TaxID=1003195 RepID=G8XE10_STREN|nr:hypothetical protein SCATT_p00790 [Streptantibioticus cattleyicolor NRRL 8057 = DSM 46488]